MTESLWRARIGRVVARRAVMVTIAGAPVLLPAALGAQAREPQPLPRVTIEAEIKNQVGGVVFDRKDAPVPGVRVEFIGLDKRLMTDSAGRFNLTDLKPGLYLMQFSKSGYRVAQRSVRVTEKLEREVAVRLEPIGRSRYTAEVAAVVAKEADSRLGLRTFDGAVIGRDELEKFKKGRLIDVLPWTSGREAVKRTSMECVLVDGHEPAMNGGPAMARDTRGPRGQRVNMGAGRSGPPPPPPERKVSWLSHFRADEVEFVEIYPQDSDGSRTLCQRFTTSSGCSCPPEASGVVIWLR
jgi:hypothetical protein